MCVVCYVGDSRTMTIENLNEVYRMVKASDEKIWLHADACHGFSLAFSEKLKKKFLELKILTVFPLIHIRYWQFHIVLVLYW